MKFHLQSRLILLNLKKLKLLLFLIFFSLSFHPFSLHSQPVSTTEALPIQSIQHTVFSDLIRRFVSKQGLVDYRSFKKDKEAQQKLNNYLDDLMKIDSMQMDSLGERMAYWLNLYNGLVIQEILKHYPVQSVTQIPHFYDQPRYTIAGFENQKSSLLDIEQIFHDRLPDARLHLARSNGAFGGPPLLREAYAGATVDKKLDEINLEFLSDSSKNYYDPIKNTFLASPIFLWFEPDFIRTRVSVRLFIQERLRLPPAIRIGYGSFDWKLNDTALR